jgi:cell wall-associated NlpC family hydrolase
VAVRGLPLAYIALGGVLLYSGLENVTMATLLRDLASGKKPVPGPPETYATPAVASAGSGTPATGSAIANDALQYVGHPYSYGGYEADPAGWDCSSFVNWVLGHDFGMTLPGGVTDYNGTSHGPVVAQYQIWSGASHISQSAVQAGDLILYTTIHMGIATSSTEFVSAEDPASGTAVAPITSGPGPWNAVRITASVNPAPTPSGTTTSVLGEL